MVTTIATDDYMGRDLVTPDTDARDYIGRAIGAGDVDFMGRALVGGGGGGDVSALLAEAAVRFDFSEYDDIADMVDVNGGWGPLTTEFTNVGAPEFTDDGLRLVDDEGELDMIPGLLITGMAGPLTFGPNGFTFLSVILMPDDRVEEVTVPFLSDFAADVANNFAPSVSLQWTLAQIPGDPDEFIGFDQYLFKIQDGDPTFAYVVNQDNLPGEVTPLIATGPVIMCGVCDVVAEETRLRLMTSDSASSFDETFPFLASPPSFVAAPMQADYLHIGQQTALVDMTYVEWLGWNRALTEAEVDALVAHFTA